jgi:hypothetical protein
MNAQPDANGWYPMDAAPLDGSEVILFVPDDHPQQVVGQYETADEWQGWQYTDTNLRDVCPEGPRPTAWRQTLPEPINHCNPVASVATAAGPKL